MKYKLTKVTWGVTLRLGRGVGLYLCLVLVGLDGSFRIIIMYVYYNDVYYDNILMYNMNSFMLWWLSFREYNLIILLKVWYLRILKGWLSEVGHWFWFLVGHTWLWMIIGICLIIELVDLMRFMSNCLAYFNMDNFYSCLWCYSVMIVRL